MRLLACLVLMVALSPGAVAAGPAAPASAWRAADQAWRSSDIELARGLTAELVARFPDDPMLWLRLGDIEQKRGDFAAALLAYDSVLATGHDPTLLATARVRRASLLITEASRDLDASGDAPLIEDAADNRAALRRALGFARESRAARTHDTSSKTAGTRARGYVLDAHTGTGQGARP